MVLTGTQVGFLNNMQIPHEVFFSFDKLSDLQRHGLSLIVRISTETSEVIQATLTLTTVNYAEQLEAILATHTCEVTYRPPVKYRVSRTETDVISRPVLQRTNKEDRYRIMERIADPTSPRTNAGIPLLNQNDVDAVSLVTLGTLHSLPPIGDIALSDGHRQDPLSNFGEPFPHKHIGKISSPRRRAPRNDSQVLALFDELTEHKSIVESGPNPRYSVSQARVSNSMCVLSTSSDGSPSPDTKRLSTNIEPRSRDVVTSKPSVRNTKQSKGAPRSAKNDRFDPQQSSSFNPPAPSTPDQAGKPVSFLQLETSSLLTRIKESRPVQATGHDTDYDDFEDEVLEDQPSKTRARLKKDDALPRKRQKVGIRKPKKVSKTAIVKKQKQVVGLAHQTPAKVSKSAQSFEHIEIFSENDGSIAKSCQHATEHRNIIIERSNQDLTSLARHGLESDGQFQARDDSTEKAINRITIAGPVRFRLGMNLVDEEAANRPNIVQWCVVSLASSMCSQVKLGNIF